MDLKQTLRHFSRFSTVFYAHFIQLPYLCCRKLNFYILSDFYVVLFFLLLNRDRIIAKVFFYYRNEHKKSQPKNVILFHPLPLWKWFIEIIYIFMLRKHNKYNTWCEIRFYEPFFWSENNKRRMKLIQRVSIQWRCE